MDFKEATEKLRVIARDNGLEGALNKLAEECAEYTAARLQYHERKTARLERRADGCMDPDATG